MRGRSSVYALAFRGAMPLGNLVAGFLATFLTAPRVLMFDGLLLISVGAVVLFRHSRSGVTSL